MRVRVEGREFRINKKASRAAARSLSVVLQKVKEAAHDRGDDSYYLVFVMTMYIISYNILKTASLDSILEMENREARKSS